MYKSIFKVYVIIVKLNWRERKRRINVFSFIFEFYNNDFADIIKVIEFVITKLNKRVLININEIEYIMCVYIITYVDDMK